jgi:hypothetical protein
MERRQRSVQYVVDAVVAAGLFNHRNVPRFLDHANDPLASCRAGAINARVHIGDVVAGRAQQQPGLQLAHCIGQRSRIFGAGAKYVEGETLRALGADAR